MQLVLLFLKLTPTDFPSSSNFQGHLQSFRQRKQKSRPHAKMNERLKKSPEIDFLGLSYAFWHDWFKSGSIWIPFLWVTFLSCSVLIMVLESCWHRSNSTWWRTHNCQNFIFDIVLKVWLSGNYIFFEKFLTNFWPNLTQFLGDQTAHWFVVWHSFCDLFQFWCTCP